MGQGLFLDHEVIETEVGEKRLVQVPQLGWQSWDFPPARGPSLPLDSISGPRLLFPFTAEAGSRGF